MTKSRGIARIDGGSGTCLILTALGLIVIAVMFLLIGGPAFIHRTMGG